MMWFGGVVLLEHGTHYVEGMRLLAFTSVGLAIYVVVGSWMFRDGKWLAYTSNEPGRVELFVTSFPNIGSKWQISNGGVTLRDTRNVMDWSSDRKNLRYEQEEKIYNLEVRNKGDKLEFSPHELMNLPPDDIVFSIMPDGKRTLVGRSTGDRSSVPIDLVLKWQHSVQ
jgi:hypothetical protein